MAEGLQTPEGEKIDIDPANVEREFSRAMADPEPGENAKPPRRSKPADGDKRPPRRGRPSKSERARTPKPAPKAQSDAERADGVKGLVQVAAGLCMVADSRTAPDNIAFKADAITLSDSAGPISAACVEVAKNNAQFAAVLDRVTSAGPYAALISVGVQVGAQIAANHGVAAAKVMGAKSPEEVLAPYVKQAQAQAQARAQQEAA